MRFAFLGSSSSVFAFLLALSLAVAPLSLVGCQTEDASTVDQDRIYADYWLYYDDGTDTTTVRASFRLGSSLGTLLRLTGESRVSFEGMPLPLNDALGTHERAIAGFVDGGTFTYVNADGRTFRNTVGRVIPISLPTDLDALERGETSTLTWIGAPSGTNEAVVVGARSDRVLDIQLSTTRTFGATTVTLDAAQLDRLPLGTVYLGLQRFQDFATGDATSVGAHVWSTYAATERRITVR
jgi:hypothetical protein